MEKKLQAQSSFVTAGLYVDKRDLLSPKYS